MTISKGSLAKVSRPRLYDAVARKRLFALLDKQRQHPVIWVSGPPGSGKSTLIGSYIDSRKLPALWLQVDAGDADVSTFFFYLGEATKQLAPRRKRLPLLTPEHRADLPAFTRRFGRALFEQLPADSMLVLDNFQEAAHDGLYQQVVSDLIAQVPETSTLIVISRRDPEATFASHLANQTIAVLPWQELRLTEEEALALAKAKSTIPPQLIKEAYSRANGWAAGLILMLESLKYGEQNLETLSGQSQEAIFAYFAQQTLNKADATAQRILAQLSVLPSFKPHLARELTGESTTPDVLEYLFRNHLFTTRRFDTAVEYEFHPLFRAFLFSQLKAQTNDAELRELQRRAGRLLVAEGAIDSAVDLLISAQDWASAANVLQLNAEKLYGQGRFSTLSGWLSQFPADVIADLPWLAYWQGTCTALTNFRNGRIQLEQAFDGFKQSGDKLGEILCAAQIIEIVYFQFENYSDFSKWLDHLERLDSMTFAFPSIEMRLQVLSAHLRAIVFYRPSSALRLPLVESLESEITNKSNVNRRVSAALALVTHASVCGPLNRAQSTLELVEKLSASSDLAEVFCVYIGQVCGFWYWYNGNFALALQTYERTAEWADKLDLKVRHFIAQYIIGSIHIAIGSASEGDEIAQNLQNLHRPQNPLQAWILSYFRLFVALKGQNRQAAIVEIEYTKVLDELGSAYYSCGQRIHAAISYAIFGMFGEARQSLSDLREMISVHYPLCESYFHFTRAFVAIREQNLSETRDALEKGFETAKHMSGPGAVGWMLGQTAEILSTALKLEIGTATSRDWIRRMQLTCPDPNLAQWPWPIKIYTLGQFVVQKDDVPLVFGKKAPKRLLQLLKAVVVFGGENVPKDKLFEAIWPDDDAATASDALKVAIGRLRLLLGNDSAIVLQGGNVSINRGVCWVDLYAFESSSKNPKPDNEDSASITDLYKGELLPEETGASWVIGPRERQRSTFLNLINEQARQLEHDGQWEQSLSAYRRGIEAENLAESFYQGQMRCYEALNKHAEGQAVYRRLRQLLSITLGIAPAAASTQLFDRLSEQA